MDTRRGFLGNLLSAAAAGVVALAAVPVAKVVAAAGESVTAIEFGKKGTPRHKTLYLEDNRCSRKGLVKYDNESAAAMIRQNNSNTPCNHTSTIPRSITPSSMVDYQYNLRNITIIDEMALWPHQKEAIDKISKAYDDRINRFFFDNRGYYTSGRYSFLGGNPDRMGGLYAVQKDRNQKPGSNGSVPGPLEPTSTLRLVGENPPHTPARS